MIATLPMAPTRRVHLGTFLLGTRLAALAFGRALWDPKGDEIGYKAQNASYSKQVKVAFKAANQRVKIWPEF